MPEDRLGDLGPGAPGDRPASRQSPEEASPEEQPAKRSAAERFSDLDTRRPEAERPQAPPSARLGSRYTWVVGVAAALVVIVVAFNSLPNAGRGYRGPAPGTGLPAFAAPSATGGLTGDANVRQADDPGNVQAGSRPACDLAGLGIVQVCPTSLRPTVVTFVTSGCEDQLDRIDAVSREFPGVSFVGVFSGKSPSEAAEAARAHGWGFPVAVDQDRAVFNLYRAGDCPTTTFAYGGGEVRTTVLGELDDARLSAEVRMVAEGAGSRR